MEQPLHADFTMLEVRNYIWNVIKAHDDGESTKVSTDRIMSVLEQVITIRLQQATRR